MWETQEEGGWELAHQTWAHPVPYATLLDPVLVVLTFCISIFYISSVARH